MLLAAQVEMKRRRTKASQQSCVFGLCAQLPICRMRMLLLSLCVLLAVTLSLGLMLSDHDARKSEDLSVRVPDLIKDKVGDTHLSQLCMFNGDDTDLSETQMFC